MSDEREAKRARASPPNWAVVFDIDGVLVHGPKPVPGAQAALRRVMDAGAAHVFVTNNGMQDERNRSLRLQSIIDVDIEPSRMILCQTPLKDEAESFGDRLVLVTGTSLHEDGGAVGLLQGLGVRNVMSVADYSACFPELMPNKKRDPSARVLPKPTEPVAAIVVVETPDDWHTDLQVMCDVLRTNGHLGQPAGTPSTINHPIRQWLRAHSACAELETVVGGLPHLAGDSQDVQLYVCNFDFTFAWADVTPRFGPGAFVRCLETMYKGVTGRDLEYVCYGKPHKPAYQFAERQLALQLPAGVSTAGMTIYAIGDNPTSDIRGANAAGDNWCSILVRTGVFDNALPNDPTDPADHVVEDVGAAIQLILKLQSEGCESV